MIDTYTCTLCILCIGGDDGDMEEEAEGDEEEEETIFPFYIWFLCVCVFFSILSCSYVSNALKLLSLLQTR